MRKDFKDKAKRRAAEMPILGTKPDYCKAKRLGDEEDMVYCKLCGVQIKEWRNVNGKLDLRDNDLYAEITLHFEDGSKHEDCLCFECAPKVDVETAEYIYAQVLAQWIREDDKLGLRLHNSFWEMVADRKIESVSLGSRFEREV